MTLPPASLSSRLVDLYLQGRWIWLGIAIVIAIIAWPAAQRVKFDRSVERMFASDDPLLGPWNRLKADFGGNEVVLAVYRDENLLNADGSGLARVAKLRDRLEKIDGVQDVLSLAEINSLVEKIEAFNITKPKGKGPPIVDAKNQTGQNFLALFEGYTHGPDQKVAAFACMLEPPPAGKLLDATRRNNTISGLRAVIHDLPDGLKGGVLAGEPVMVVEGFDMLDKDGKRLWLWSTVMLALTVIICFFSFRWLIAPLAVVNWALLLTQATLVWLQLELTMVSSMLSAIITVVGVASVVHLIVRCRELEAEGIPQYSAFRTSILALAIPIGGAIATDVGGFGSLWSAKVGPVQDFGTMMFIGSLVVVPAISLLLPAISLLGVKKPKANEKEEIKPVAAHTSWIDDRLHTVLTGLLNYLRARQVSAGIVITLVAIFIAFGALRLDVETDFTRNFRSDSQVVKSYEFVETQLGGAGVWDVMIPAPRKLDDAYLAKVRNLEKKLRAIEIPKTEKEPARRGLTKVISLVDALDVIKVDGLLSLVPITTEIKIQKMMEELPIFTAALRSVPKDPNEPSRLRIMLRARERQSAEQKRWLIEQVRTITLAEFPLPANASDPRAGAEVTGFFVLLTSLIESMLRDQWMTFAVATAAMGFIILVLFRSFKLAIIGIIPNVVPIFLVMGLVGWIGLRINMGAAMIAAVSMGLSVDSSIHYLDSFLHARRHGKSVADALAEVQSSVGRAMLFTTLTLDLGFLVLCTSEFIPTVYFGALVSLAMIGGLAGNLIILPLLIGWFVRD